MTYVYRELSVDEIARELRNGGYAGWSLNGSYTLAEHLVQIADETETPIELDVVALRCELSEYASLAEFNSAHDTEYASWEDVSDDRYVILFDDDRSAIVYDQ